jgi:hypothetical protein
MVTSTFCPSEKPETVIYRLASSPPQLSALTETLPAAYRSWATKNTDAIVKPAMMLIRKHNDFHENRPEQMPDIRISSKQSTHPIF